MSTILITGATRGIGLAMATHYAEGGHNVIMNYGKNDTRAKDAYNRVKDVASDNVLLCKASVYDRSQVISMYAQAVERFGCSVDVLINNAGLNIDKPFMDLRDDDWDRVVDTNLKGVFIMSQEFARQNTNDVNSHIINIASGTSIVGRKNGANYCSSKAGVLTLSKCMALELAPDIRVNTIVLGYVNTEEVVKRYNLDDEDSLNKLLSQIPLNYVGSTRDVIDMIDFIISTNIYTTGQKFVINGGNIML